MTLPRSELGLRVLPFALAFALLVVVHGERVVTTTFTVPSRGALRASVRHSPELTTASIRAGVLPRPRNRCGCDDSR